MKLINTSKIATEIAPSFTGIRPDSVFRMECTVYPPLFHREDVPCHLDSEEPDGTLDLPDGFSDQQELDCVLQIIIPLIQVMTGLQFVISSADIDEEYEQWSPPSIRRIDKARVEKKLKEKRRLSKKDWLHVRHILFTVIPSE